MRIGALAAFLCIAAALPAPAGEPAKIQLKVPFFPDKTDQCGPATLAGVLTFWGKNIEPAQLRKEMYVAKLRGSLPMDLLYTAHTHGLDAEMVRGDLPTVQTELKAGRPVLAMLNVGYSVMPVNHYVVITGFDDSRGGVLMHSAGSPNQFVAYRKFLRQWEKADFWAMLSRPAAPEVISGTTTSRGL